VRLNPRNLSSGTSTDVDKVVKVQFIQECSFFTLFGRFSMAQLQCLYIRTYKTHCLMDNGCPLVLLIIVLLNLV
jgi:hypothetical protein